MKVLCFTFLYIFSFSLCAEQKGPLKKNAYIAGNVFDENKVPTDAHIDIVDFETKQLDEQTESTGGFSIPVTQKNSYIVYISKPGYLFQSVMVSIPDSIGYTKKLPDIIMQKVEVEKKTVLNGLSFDFYQAIVLEESRPDLERVIALLNEKLSLQIEISGFTDNIGSVTFLRKTSEQRAKAVMDVLISSGFDKNRIKYKGYGAQNPLGSNFTEEGRQLNNRVELKVLSTNLTTKIDPKQKNGILKGIKKEPNPEDPDGLSEEEQASAILEEKEEANIKFEQEQEEFKDSVATALKKVNDTPVLPVPDSLNRIDLKGKFFADKNPLAFSTVNLITSYGEITKTTKTDQFGLFEFKDVDPDEEVTFGLDENETKDFKKIFLADTTGAIVKELDKVNGEFVLTLLPSEKTKLGKVYLIDPPLKGLKMKSKQAFIIGRIVDESKNPIKAQIEVIDNITNQAVEKSQSDSEGRFKITSALNKNYDITFNKSGFLFQSVSIVIPDSGGFEKNLGDVTLQKVEVGKKIVLNNIFFDSNESTLRKESFTELERAVKLMNDMGSLQMEISGHTDNIGSEKSNKQLSELRAKAVKDFLISKGCDKDRLKYKGYGSVQPISNNNSERGRQLNRRTEFKVLKVDLAAEQVAKVKQMKETSTNADKQTEETEVKTVKLKNSSAIPKPLQDYDKDSNGVISYAEIIMAIDLFFEENAKENTEKKANQSIFTLLDFYFEQ